MLNYETLHEQILDLGQNSGTAISLHFSYCAV